MPTDLQAACQVRRIDVGVQRAPRAGFVNRGAPTSRPSGATHCSIHSQSSSGTGKRLPLPLFVPWIGASRPSRPYRPRAAPRGSRRRQGHALLPGGFPSMPSTGTSHAWPRESHPEPLAALRPREPSAGAPPPSAKGIPARHESLRAGATILRKNGMHRGHCSVSSVPSLAQRATTTSPRVLRNRSQRSCVRPARKNRRPVSRNVQARADRSAIDRRPQPRHAGSNKPSRREQNDLKRCLAESLAPEAYLGVVARGNAPSARNKRGLLPASANARKHQAGDVTLILLISSPCR